MARQADIDRGWAKSCSKSCAATANNKKTGNYQRYCQTRNNYAGSGVSKETYQHYAREYGGTPQFNRKGEYIGFTDGCFDNTSCQNEE